MKMFLDKLKIKLGLYEVVKNIHKYNPMYKLIKSLLKEEIKKQKAIKLKDLM